MTSKYCSFLSVQDRLRGRILLYILKGIIKNIVNCWGCISIGHNGEHLHYWCGLHKLFFKNNIQLVYIHNTMTVLNAFLKNVHKYLTETNLLQLMKKMRKHWIGEKCFINTWPLHKLPFPVRRVLKVVHIVYIVLYSFDGRWMNE